MQFGIHARARRSCALASISILSATSASAALPLYQVQDLGTLGGGITQATDLNESGQVTGYSETADGELRAFLYSRGQLRDLGTLGGEGSLGNAINNLGHVTGFASTPSGRTRAVVYANGAIQDPAISGADSVGNDINALGQIAGQRLGPDNRLRAFSQILGITYDLKGPTGFDSYGTAINDLGQVLGTYYDKAGSHAFLATFGIRKDLVPGKVSMIYSSQALNNLGHVTGAFVDGGNTHGFVYQNGRLTRIGHLGGSYSFGFGINDRGDVTGVSALADGRRHAIVYSGGRTTDLGTLGGPTSFGYAINLSKQVAGESMLSSGGYHAFVYSQGKLTDLGAAIEALHGRGYLESVAYDINNVGQVIGRYYMMDANNRFTFRGFIATPVVRLLDVLLRDVTGVGPGKSLQSKVSQSRTAYLAQNKSGACSGLLSLQKEITAQTGKKIQHATAAALQGQAKVLVATLSCK